MPWARRCPSRPWTRRRSGEIMGRPPPKISVSGPVIPVGVLKGLGPHGTPAKLNPAPKHANSKGRAGGSDEPSFGRAPGGPGPWKQV